MKNEEPEPHKISVMINRSMLTVDSRLCSKGRSHWLLSLPFRGFVRKSINSRIINNNGAQSTVVELGYKQISCAILSLRVFFLLKTTFYITWSSSPSQNFYVAWCCSLSTTLSLLSQTVCNFVEETT